MSANKLPLLLFAKAPVAGNVKTRLTTHCSEQQAAKIAEVLIDESLRIATQHWPGKVLLSIWQLEDHSFIQEMLNKYKVELHRQVAGDLGEKMQSAFDSVGYPAAILGCDAPVLTANTLIKSYSLLSEGANVIGPSEDGGYYLVGLSRSAPALFKEIKWGQSSVYSSTKKIAKQSKIDIAIVAKSYDIDRWDDVIRAAEQIPKLKQYLLAEGFD